MPRKAMTDSTGLGRLETLTSRAWWIVFPPFALLVGRLTFERACADPYSLVQSLASRPAAAWPLALLYVAAHVWLIVVYLRTVARTDALWPSLAEFRAIQGTDVIKAILMAIVLAIEYSPVSFWRLVGEAACTP
jgi:hypothetical protein